MKYEFYNVNTYLGLAMNDTLCVCVCACFKDKAINKQGYELFR